MSSSTIRFCLGYFFMTALFSIGLPRRNHFWLRLGISVPVLAACLFGASKLLTLITFGRWTWWLIFVPYVALILSAVAVCFDARGKEMLFVGTGAYALEHIAYCVGVIAAYFIQPTFKYGTLPYQLLFEYLPYLVIGTFVYFTVIGPNAKTMEMKQRDWRQLLLSFVVVLSCIFLSSITFGSPYLANFVCKCYAILVASMALVIQYFMSGQNKLQREYDAVQWLLHMEKQQHDLSKETIDIINMKCHDLKHQISKLENMDYKSMRHEYIDEIKKAVNIYDSMTKTGNDALDVILMEKTLLCEQRSIRLSCIIDGARMSFMSTPDIYSFFGNALDNAIENVTKLDVEKRLISLRVSGEGEMTLFHIDNRVETDVAFDEEGMPKTTKDDKEFHGFGLKSMRYIANKYGADLKISVENNRFCVDVLFSN